MHYLNSRLDFFTNNMGDVRKEHGERFHQDIKKMETRYQGRWNKRMLGNQMWGIVREDQKNHKIHVITISTVYL